MIAVVCALAFYQYGRGIWVPVYSKFAGRTTVAEVVTRIGVQTEQKLLHRFTAAGVAYPPTSITLLATKQEAELELWGSDGNAFQYIHTYSILKASGTTGPKLREGDKQVPEGIYSVVGLNPNSAYHLSMKLNYPNAFDLKHAAAENRTEPGTNIFIHGKAQSVGCLAMGDETIEELFVLAAVVGIENVKVVIAPKDPREHKLTRNTDTDAPWVSELYQQIETTFSLYQR
jgi:murein L,D-transpeptidase YafK